MSSPEAGTGKPTATCWCGGTLGREIGPDYSLCAACGTAVLAVPPGQGHFDVSDDDRDFYGRAYWTEYAEARSFPAIGERARADLSERCLFWIERLLEVTRPPGRALEIGCGHGGFVRLLQELGFDAAGTELSPWVVDFAKSTFGVTVLLGPLEVLPLQPGFKCIAAFDVLEHLKDPLETVQRCAALLAIDGVLLLQTPCYRGEGPEWSMFQANEHIHLFTEESMRLLLARAGFKDVRVEPSLFPYDMWVVAAPERLPVGNPAAGSDWRTPAAFRALLDMALAARDAREALRRAEIDGEARLAQVEELTGLLRESEVDRASRLPQVVELRGLLHDAETDRAARLVQIEELGGLLSSAEADRAARLVQVEELGRLLRESEADRAARLVQMEERDRLLRESGQAIEALEAKLSAIEKTATWRLHTWVTSRMKRFRSP